jgi:cytochrome c-type biogenesis protein CcmH/NrfG
MPNVEKTSTSSIWTSSQAYSLSVLCLLIGLAGGWFIRGSQGTRSASSETLPAGTQAMTGQAGEPTAEQMRRMADKQAEPLLQQLGKEPNNTEMLAKIGNIYYDTQQFPVAIDYYQRALKLKPADASIRTDMATAYWYTGNADLAISEFNRALADEPNKPNALFNLGVVQWQGKMDSDEALATWQRLLETNPNYEGKAKVVELMAQVKKHSGIKPGTQAKALPQ